MVVWTFITSHVEIFTGLGVAILDLIFALKPDANAADGVLHWVYLKLKK